MIKTMSDEAKRMIFPNYGEEHFKGMSVAVDKVAQEAQRDTLRQVVEWGGEPCYDHDTERRKERYKIHQELDKVGKPSNLAEAAQIRRHECYPCWQEFKEQAEEE